MNCSHKEKVYREVYPHIGEYCKACEKWVRWIPREEFFGKALELEPKKIENTLFPC